MYVQCMLVCIHVHMYISTFITLITSSIEMSPISTFIKLGIAKSTIPLAQGHVLFAVSISSMTRSFDRRIAAIIIIFATIMLY